MSGEEIGHEKKAKRIARAVLAEAILVLQRGDQTIWEHFAKTTELPIASEKTQARVIEILSEIAL